VGLTSLLFPSFYDINIALLTVCSLVLYIDSQAIFVVEALRNICGVSFLKDGYRDYEEFNLRKFQTAHAEDAKEFTSTSASSARKNEKGGAVGAAGSTSTGIGAGNSSSGVTTDSRAEPDDDEEEDGGNDEEEEDEKDGEDEDQEQDQE
jgi:prothymosin alpha